MLAWGKDVNGKMFSQLLIEQISIRTVLGRDCPELAAWLRAGLPALPSDLGHHLVHVIS